MIIDDDSDEVGAVDIAEGASSDIDPRCIEQDTSLDNTFVISELALMLIKSIDTSGLQYDVKEGYRIDELTPRLRSYEQ